MKMIFLLLLTSALFLQLGCNRGLVSVPLEVKELYWERVIYREEYRTVQKEAWADELPKGVKKVSGRIVPKGATIVTGEETYTEKEQYACGSTSYGPKPYQRSPKYCERDVTKTRQISRTLDADRERITYETKVWQEADKSQASVTKGNDTQEPSWNEPKIANKTMRAGRRTEFYSVTLATIEGAPKTYKRSISYEDFLRYQRGQKLLAKFFSQDSLEPLTLEEMK